MIAEISWQQYGVVAALLILLFFTVRAMKKRTQQHGAPRPRLRYAPDRSQDGRDELRRSMEKLLVELQEVSREINAQLDTKMRALTQLTDDAQRAIDRLETLTAETGAAATASPATADAPAPARAVDPRHRRVYDLIDSGLSPVEAARETGQSVGEVELILSLRQSVDA